MKNIKLFSLLFLLLFVSISLNSVIIQSDNISCINNHIEHNKKTLVIFDIDNTILFAKNTKASDFWFSAMIKEGIKNGMEELHVIEKILPYYYAAHETTEVQRVHDKIAELIRNIQNRNIMVVALTARSKPMINVTIKQLGTIGIDFSKSSPTKENFELNLSFPANFTNGIMFCASNSKAEVLKAILEKTGFNPEKIIYADDKEKYLHQIEELASTNKMEFVGIRVSTLDEMVKNFVLDQESKNLLSVKQVQKLPA